jgi:Ala-tRNA(Pro) deacylase
MTTTRRLAGHGVLMRRAIVSIATSVQNYLDREGVPYGTILHEHTRCSTRSAQAAHIPGDRIAKCVMLQDDQDYLMAVIPATHKVDLGALHRQLHRNLGLATDREILELFKDCEPGALPPLGRAYGIDAILDECLAEGADIYFEAGDHRALVHTSGSDFLKLMADAPRGQISHHM